MARNCKKSSFRLFSVVHYAVDCHNDFKCSIKVYVVHVRNWAIWEAHGHSLAKSGRSQTVASRGI